MPTKTGVRRCQRLDGSLSLMAMEVETASAMRPVTRVKA